MGWVQKYTYKIPASKIRSHKGLDKNVYTSYTHHCVKLEITQIFFNRCMDAHAVVHLWNYSTLWRSEQSETIQKHKWTSKSACRVKEVCTAWLYLYNIIENENQPIGTKSRSLIVLDQQEGNPKIIKKFLKTWIVFFFLILFLVIFSQVYTYSKKKPNCVF